MPAPVSCKSDEDKKWRHEHFHIIRNSMGHDRVESSSIPDAAFPSPYPTDATYFYKIDLDCRSGFGDMLI